MLQDGNLVGEMHPYHGRKSMSTNFPGFPQDFVTFSRAMGNWRGNQCISHMMRYTTGLKSNGKKAPILWEKYEYQFPRSSPYNRFCWIFLGYEKSMGKPMYFPCNEVYHRMEIEWQKSTHTRYKIQKTLFLIRKTSHKITIAKPNTFYIIHDT